MSEEKSDVERVRNARKKITDAKVKQVTQNSIKSQAQIGKKESSFNYQTGQFE
jgi:hypothetical protein